MANPGERIADVVCTDDKLTVDLEDGRTISVPMVRYPRLLHATAEQRRNWESAGGGFGIHWPCPGHCEHQRRLAGLGRAVDADLDHHLR